MKAYSYHLAKGIVPSDRIDNNQVHTNIVYYPTMASGIHEITTEQAYSNSEIAHQCPLSGGKCVYLARTLMTLISPDEYYDDKNVCLLAGIVLRKRNGLPLRNLEIYPNPASTLITANAILLHDKGVIYVTDVTGRVLTSLVAKREQKEYQIDVSNLANGLYNISLKDGASISHTVKLSVIK
ncbi:MAG: Secretion system C-terminal sorting domain [Bacteroidota bacterium]|jgi:hypothetical protein